MCPKIGLMVRFSTATVIALAMCGNIVLAQRVTKREKVRFQAGRTSTVVSGAVSGKTSNEYLLDARKGQRLTVHVSGQKGAVFDIYQPNGSALSQLEVTDWDEAALPRSGTYRILVYGETENLSPRKYTLEIGIR